MKYKVNYTKESLNDLSNIYDYIAYEENEVSNAKRLIDAIRNAIKNLDEFPNRFPIVTFSPWKELNMRYLCIKNHIAFYLVNDNTSCVNIIRIFSSKQNIEKLILK